MSETQPLDIVLRPHRSLSPTGFWIIMSILAAWSFAGGIVFLLVGAWPVIGFVGIDVALVWWAFKASYGDQRAHERLRLVDGTLIVDRVDKRGAVESTSFPAYWLRVGLEAPAGRQKQVVLTSHGRRQVIGAFLSPDERADLVRYLEECLTRARATPLPESPAESVQIPSTSRIV
jgi:uncharacterized membrane protein